MSEKLPSLIMSSRDMKTQEVSWNARSPTSLRALLILNTLVLFGVLSVAVYQLTIQVQLSHLTEIGSKAVVEDGKNAIGPPGLVSLYSTDSLFQY